MERFSRQLALVFLAAAGSAGGLAGQVLGLPVRNAGIGTGFGIAADVGFPDGEAGKGLALGATATLGAGPLGVSGSVATWNPKGPGKSIQSFGATGNLKVIGGPLIPLSVTLQAGAGRYTESGTTIEGDAFDVKTWHVPVGVGIALTIPNPVFAIKPWVAPRLDLSRVTTSDGGTASTITTTIKDFGVSAGVDLGFLNGLTIRAMYDRVMRGEGVNPGILSVGLGFKVGS